MPKKKSGFARRAQRATSAAGLQLVLFQTLEQFQAFRAAALGRERVGVGGGKSAVRGMLGVRADVPPEEWNTQGRLLAAWRGERNLGQRLLELAVVGLADESSVREATAQTVRAILQPAPPKV
ncbi:MAG: hypothetical protein ABIR71_03725 [Chthoniobacterales bacterium]